KIDLLGQAGLSVLRDAVNEINRTLPGTAPAAFDHQAQLVDLTRDVDYSEPETWDMIATGNARGVHHIESPAMTSLIQQCNCRDIDCLTAVVAIIRPGAANQGKKEAFARRYQGFEPPSYTHPSLVGALEKTYGLMVFEEHILQVAVEFAGMNLGRADVLRRALNKQNLPLIAELKSEFYACALQKGRQTQEIDTVWPFVEGFAGFMFNKAHSAEYAVEAFQGAWLKRRWPAHYIAAILSNYRGFYASSPTLPQILYVMEAHRLGIRFLPPCVNRSREHFSVEHFRMEPSPLWCRHPGCTPGVGCVSGVGCTPGVACTPGIGCTQALEGRRSIAEGVSPRETACVPIQALEGRQKPFRSSSSLDSEISNLKSEISNLKSQLSDPRGLAIRVPVSHIASLSQSFLDRYTAARTNGPFASLTDFVDRCQPSESEAQSLLDAGVFDCLGPSRPLMFWQLRKFLRHSAIGPTLWSAALDRDEPAPPIEFTEPDTWQIAQREMDLLGFPITLDPLTFLSRDDKDREIDWSRYVPVDQLGRHLRRRVAVCGLMVADRINATQTGDLMKFVTLADRTGFIETILFPDAYQRFGHLTVANPILAATGVVEPFENNNGFTLRVQQVSLPQRKKRTSR
ncbi:MAG TPA: hypothetical protein VMV94_14155, partial [Phycisphaerae bacterium]|nr:hypothetical protein [Phycisphaerae bacterium]